MRIIITINLFLLFIIPNTSFSQGKINTALSVNIEFGLSSDGNNSNRYPFDVGVTSDIVLVHKREFRILHNYNFSYTRFFAKEHGISLSCGISSFGFEYEGISENSGIEVSGYFQTNRSEIGVSYIHRSALSPKAFLLFEPGIRYHNEGDFTTNRVWLIGKSAYSFSGFAGLEFPQTSTGIFTCIGIQVKAALSEYNRIFSTSEPFYPYFIGIRLGVNFRFHWL